jgi:hypothetical protein
MNHFRFQSEHLDNYFWAKQLHFFPLSEYPRLLPLSYIKNGGAQLEMTLKLMGIEILISFNPF